MTTRRKVLIGVAAAIVLAVSVVGVSLASGADDDEGGSLPVDARDRAVAAALASTGGGEVLEVEPGDDGAAFEVEIRRPDGTVVEIELDDAFAVIGRADDDGGGAEGAED